MEQITSDCNELGEFLKKTRAKLTAEQVGLPTSTLRRRHTKTLRQEDVAGLIPIATSWYAQLEQGRNVDQISVEILHKLADRLLLNLSERRYLFSLMGRGLPASTLPEEKVTEALQRTIDGLQTYPCYVMGRRWDILAWNQAACRVFGDFTQIPLEQRNIMWMMFGGDELRKRIEDWEGHAQRVMAQFRASYGLYVGDLRFLELIDRLKKASDEFCVWWPDKSVQGRADVHKNFYHDKLGWLAFELTSMQSFDVPDLMVVVYTACETFDTPQKLTSLIS